MLENIRKNAGFALKDEKAIIKALEKSKIRKMRKNKSTLPKRLRKTVKEYRS